MNESNVSNREIEGDLGVMRWGKKWQEFMDECYPEDAAALRSNGKWSEIAANVEREASDYAWSLRTQYAKKLKRPTTFMEIVKWENTRSFIVDHAVMEDIVLQYRA